MADQLFMMREARANGGLNFAIDGPRLFQTKANTQERWKHRRRMGARHVGGRVQSRESRPSGESRNFGLGNTGDNTSQFSRVQSTSIDQGESNNAPGSALFAQQIGSARHVAAEPFWPSKRGMSFEVQDIQYRAEEEREREFMQREAESSKRHMQRLDDEEELDAHPLNKMRNPYGGCSACAAKKYAQTIQRHAAPYRPVMGHMPVTGGCVACRRKLVGAVVDDEDDENMQEF